METIVRKALEKQRHGRYRSAAELADDLRRYLAGGEVTIDIEGIGQLTNPVIADS